MPLPRGVERHGSSYRARYTVNGRRMTQTGFATSGAAAAWLTQTKADILRGQWIDPQAGTILIKTYAAQWLEDYQTEDSTRATVTSHVNRHIIPEFGDLTLTELRRERVRAWVTKLEKQHKPSYVRSLHGTLARIMHQAVEDDRIRKSPCKGTTLPPDRTDEKRFFTVAEVDRFATAIAGRFRAFVLLAAYTGMRPAELYGLDEDALDLTRGTVSVGQVVARTATGGSRYLRPYPKTSGSIRTLGIPQEIALEVAAHLETYRAGPRDYPGPDGTTVRRSLVFTTPSGTLIRDNDFRTHVYGPGLLAAKLGKARVHDLRHTHAAWLIAEGAEPKKVQRRMGHSSIKTTYDVYGHLFPEADREIVEGLERQLRSIVRKHQAV